MVSASRVRSAAAKISSSWSSFDTPTMVDATKSCCLLHAVASVIVETPISAAMAANRSVEAMVLSLTKRRAIVA